MSALLIVRSVDAPNGISANMSNHKTSHAEIGQTALFTPNFCVASSTPISQRVKATTGTLLRKDEEHAETGGRLWSSNLVFQSVVWYVEKLRRSSKFFWRRTVLADRKAITGFPFHGRRIPQQCTDTSKRQTSVMGGTHLRSVLTIRNIQERRKKAHT